MRALNSPGALLHKVLVAGVFVRREFERRRRLRHLLGGLIDLGFLARDLGFEVFFGRFVLTDLRVGLVDRGFIVSCVDGREQIPCFHDLVIGDIDADNAASDLRADQH